MKHLPQAIKLGEFEWTVDGVIQQFMHTSVLEASDRLRTLASGMVRICANVAEEPDTQLCVIAPLVLQGEAEHYEDAWEGVISIDDRQPTHIAWQTKGEVVEFKQVLEGLEHIEALYKQIFQKPENQLTLYEALSYKKATSAIDASLEHPNGILELKVRFFPTVFTTAKPVCTIVKETSELLAQGANFLPRGAYTQYLLLLTWKKRWVLCIRSSETADVLPVEGVINETIRVFDYDDEDQVINYLLETGFDPLDNDLDVLNEHIANEILLHG